jgi:hypothetical protein
LFLLLKNKWLKGRNHPRYFYQKKFYVKHGMASTAAWTQAGMLTSTRACHPGYATVHFCYTTNNLLQNAF